MGRKVIYDGIFISYFSSFSSPDWNFQYECGCFWHIWSPFFSLCVCRTSGVSMHEKEIYPVAGKIELFSWEFFSLLKLICEENFASTVETTANERERWNLRMMLEGITRQSQNHHQSSPTTSAGIHHFHETEFDSISVAQFFLFSASHLKSNFTGRRNMHVEC